MVVHLHKLSNKLDQGLAVESRESNARRRLVQAFHVLVRTEQPGSSVLILVCLHSLETLESVVEDAGGGVQAEVLVGDNARGVPAIGSGPLNCKHMI